MGDSDDDGNNNIPNSQSSGRLTLYCPECRGHRTFNLDEDGFYSCIECGSQPDHLIPTATPMEDLRPEGGLYNFRFRSTQRSQSQNRDPDPDHTPKSSQHHLIDKALRSLTSQKGVPLGVKSIGFGDVEGVYEPRDFGARGCCDRDKLTDGIRFRYVKGLQVMVQMQCQVLVERFHVSAYVIGIVGKVWLRYVAMTRVLADDWPERVIEESEMAAEAAGMVRVVKQEDEKPQKLKRARTQVRSEPRNAYGQTVIQILLRSLRKTLPLKSTLAISFLVCHIAREPILPTDICTWAAEGKLPYVTAFTEMDACLGNPSSVCPLSSSSLFRPLQVIGAWELEATAASIAQIIGLRLSSVNFYAIASRYLKELYLPVEKILPHACHIYEWSLPAELWLSSSASGFPTRTCVMSILIVAMRLLYNIQGQGTWEKSKYEARNPPSNNQTANLTSKFTNSSNPKYDNANDDHCTETSSKPYKKLLRLQASDYNLEELLSILEVTFVNISRAHDYTKDLSSYLKYCKDVVYLGIAKSYEEQNLIDRLWKMYEKQENIREEQAPRPRNGNLNPRKEKQDSQSTTTPMDEDIVAGSHPKEPLILPSCPAVSAKVAIEKIKHEMEENGFSYLPPRTRQKISYTQYKRRTIDGKLVFVAHADYYIVLRACAKLVEVDVQTMHRCVLSLERRLQWIDNQIDNLFCHPDGLVDPIIA